MKRFAFALALAAALPFAAQAAEFNQVQTDKSAITFGYQQMGVKMDGRFKKFAARLNFDPAKPTDAKASFDVDLASVDTGAPEGRRGGRRQAVVQHQGLPDRAVRLRQPSRRSAATATKSPAS